MGAKGHYGMIDEDFEQEIQKKKRRVLIFLVCLFVLAGGGFVAQRDALVEETIEGGTVTAVPVANVTAQSTPTETPTPQIDEPEVDDVSNTPTPTSIQTPTQTQTMQQTGQQTGQQNTQNPGAGQSTGQAGANQGTGNKQQGK